MAPIPDSRGAFYGGTGGSQFLKQIVAASFVIAWNIVVTSIICLTIKLFVPLRMPDEQLMIGDDAVHGEEAYALWGDGDKYDPTMNYGQGHVRSAQPFSVSGPANSHVASPNYMTGGRGVTINL